MAELATLARPYAEAAFQVAEAGDLKQAGEEIDALASVAADPGLVAFSESPNTPPGQLFDVITSVVRTPLSDASKNLLRTVIDNGRLTVMPEIAAQFHALASERSGVSDATIFSAFAIEPAQLADVMATLEKRFKRKLDASVEVQPDLIGGIRVVVGDEVFDISVRTRLEQMKAALTA